MEASRSAESGAGAALQGEMTSTPEDKRKLAVSVVIPTLNRPKELADLLPTMLNQHLPASEIIIGDKSKEKSTCDLVGELIPQFQFIGNRLVHLRGDGTSSTSAQNMGIRESLGDAVLFLDDDTLLEANVIEGIAEFLQENPDTLSVQARIQDVPDKHFAYSFCEPQIKLRAGKRHSDGSSSALLNVG